MKIGDVVVPKEKFTRYVPFSSDILDPNRKTSWVGLVIGFDHGDPIVYWDDKFYEEIEYAHQLEIIYER